MFAYDYPLLNIFWTMLEFFFLFLWIWLLIVVFVDIFRSHDLRGAAKAAWVILVLVLPLIGIVIYLIVRGGGMRERSAAQMRQQQEAFDDSVRQAAGSGSAADQLAKLADLKDKGAISDSEFEGQKAKILGS